MTRSLDVYLALLHDRGRLEPYIRAIRRLVRPGSVVVDLGSGLGTLAVVAASRGAKRVYAVESEAVGSLVAELARANQVGDRVELMTGRSTNLRPPARADVIIYDDLDLLGIGACATTLRDAARRWLKRGGVMIPRSVELWAAPVAAIRGAICLRPPPRLGAAIDVASLHALGHSIPWPVKLTNAASLLASPRRLASWPAAELPDHMALRQVFRATRDGQLQGIVAWLKLRLSPAISVDTGPLAPATAYPQNLFPLADRLRVSVREPIEVELHYRTSRGRGGDHQFWSWSAATRSKRSESSSFAVMAARLASRS